MLRLVPTVPTFSLFITAEFFLISLSGNNIIQWNLISLFAYSGTMNKLQYVRTALIITARSLLYET